jgi:molybdopterin-containing oxidoreductase family iron-sulfur binding subunit
MEEDQIENIDKDQSRRTFLTAGLLSGILSACNEKSPFTTDDTSIKASGEMVKLLSVDGEMIEVDRAFLKPVPAMPVSNEEARKGIAGKSFVMVIDLSRCKNVGACQTSCNHVHQVHPGQNWIKIHSMQDAEHTAPYWQPTTCMHCEEPPCVKVCPVDATFKREDGIVLIDSDRCVGCRFCMAACPYSTRVFNWEEPLITKVEAAKDYSCEHSTPQKMGTVGKCDFCPDMARKGELPHCVSACPNGVFMFGDMNEDSVTNGTETYRFSELVKEKAGYRLMEDLGTKPRVYYLPPVGRSFPYESGLEKAEPS